MVLGISFAAFASLVALSKILTILLSLAAGTRATPLSVFVLTVALTFAFSLVLTLALFIVLVTAFTITSTCHLSQRHHISR